MTTPPKVKKVYDAGGGIGGPIRSDRLWFFTAHRWWGTQNTVPNSYYSASQHSLFYVARSEPAGVHRPAASRQQRPSDLAGLRAQQDHRLGEHPEAEMFWEIDGPVLATRAPEAAIDQQYPNSITQVMWSFPATNRLLFEAGVTILRAEQNNFRMAGVAPDDIPIIDLSTGVNYNARAAIPAMGTTEPGEGSAGTNRTSDSRCPT